MLSMIGPNKKIGGIADKIVESFVNGKKESSTEKKGYSESCVMAANELISAIESKDANRVISAFVALNLEAEPYLVSEEE